MSGEAVFIWTTRRGEEIPVTEMSNSHLENALAFVQGRKAHWSGVLIWSGPVLIPGSPDNEELLDFIEAIRRLTEAETAFIDELFRRRWEAYENE